MNNIDYVVLSQRVEVADSKRAIGEAAEDPEIVSEAELDKKFIAVMFKVLDENGVNNALNS